jgi:uncharacterized membrane protein YtjA (UPF0391 family)
MLGWALTFLIVALIAAVLGFGGIAGFAVEIAKIIFFVAIILFVISAIHARPLAHCPLNRGFGVRATFARREPGESVSASPAFERHSPRRDRVAAG